MLRHLTAISSRRHLKSCDILGKLFGTTAPFYHLASPRHLVSLFLRHSHGSTRVIPFLRHSLSRGYFSRSHKLCVTVRNLTRNVQDAGKHGRNLRPRHLVSFIKHSRHPLFLMHSLGSVRHISNVFLRHSHAISSSGTPTPLHYV